MDYDQLNKAIQCNGGVVDIQVTLRIFATPALQIQCRLLIDSEVKDLGGAIGGTGGDGQDIRLSFRGKLSNGARKIQVQYKTSAGTLNINQDGASTNAYGTSSISIVEFLGV